MGVCFVLSSSSLFSLSSFAVFFFVSFFLRFPRVHSVSLLLSFCHPLFVSMFVSSFLSVLFGSDLPFSHPLFICNLFRLLCVCRLFGYEYFIARD